MTTSKKAYAIMLTRIAKLVEDLATREEVGRQTAAKVTSTAIFHIVEDLYADYAQEVEAERRGDL